MTDTDALYGQKYLDYQRKRSRLRKLIRRLYLNNILKYVKGRAIDFGCGSGELLSLCAGGSLGLDINESAVTFCRKNGLDARCYHPDEDLYQLKECETGRYGTFVMTHVLEHLDDPAGILGRIFASCGRIGIERIIIVVPGAKGFISDKTHRTFIDEAFFEHKDISGAGDYTLVRKEYYPFNMRSAGTYFTHNEMVVVYDKKR